MLDCNLTEREIRESILNGKCPFCNATNFHSIGSHTSLKHGIKVDELRKMAGIGRAARLTSDELYQKLSNERKSAPKERQEQNKKNLKKGLSTRGDVKHIPSFERTVVRQSFSKKQKYVWPLKHPPTVINKVRKCKNCGKEFVAASNSRTACSDECRHILQSKFAKESAKWKIKRAVKARLEKLKNIPSKSCKIEECERSYHSKGFCDYHYRKYLKTVKSANPI